MVGVVVVTVVTVVTDAVGVEEGATAMGYTDADVAVAAVVEFAGLKVGACI